MKWVLYGLLPALVTAGAVYMVHTGAEQQGYARGYAEASAINRRGFIGCVDGQWKYGNLDIIGEGLDGTPPVVLGSPCRIKRGRWNSY